MPIDGKDIARITRSPTFEQAFWQHFNQRKEGLKSAKHIQQWRSTMVTYAFPVIGNRQVADVTHDEIVAILKPIWRTKAETARRTLERLEIIFNIAISRGLREKANPCTGVPQDLGMQGDRVRHLRSMPYQEVPAFLRALRSSRVEPITKLAFEFLILTLLRSGEVRGADWSESDVQNALCSVPGPRMKAKVTHVVPFSTRCLKLLEEVRGLLGCGVCTGLIFPGRWAGEQLSDMTFTKVLRDMGVAEKATAHGFRSTFRDWAAETHQCRDEVAEAALAHVVKHKVKPPTSGRPTWKSAWA